MFCCHLPLPPHHSVCSADWINTMTNWGYSGESIYRQLVNHPLCLTWHVSMQPRSGLNVLTVVDQIQLLLHTPVQSLRITFSVNAGGHYYSYEPPLLLLSSVGCPHCNSYNLAASSSASHFIGINCSSHSKLSRSVLCEQPTYNMWRTSIHTSSTISTDGQLLVNHAPAP